MALAGEIGEIGFRAQLRFNRDVFVGNVGLTGPLGTGALGVKHLLKSD